MEPEVFVGGAFAVLAAAIPVIVKLWQTRQDRLARQRKIEAATEELVKQLQPSNGVKLSSYIERIGEVHDLVKEARDIAIRNEGKIDGHLASHGPVTVPVPEDVSS